MKKNLKIAIVQASVEKTKEDSEAQVIEMVAKAVKTGGEMIGLPEECISADYIKSRENYDPLAFLSSVAKKYKVYLFGAVYLNDGKDVDNRGFIFDKKGKLILIHDKVVPTPIEIKNLSVDPGKLLQTVDTEFGRIGMLVCKDSFNRFSPWFFEMFREAGTDIVLIPSYSLYMGKESIDLWVEPLRTQARWFNVFIAAPGTVGSNATPFPSFGHAVIIDPNGEVLAEGSKSKEEILTANLKKSVITEARQENKSWQPEKVPNVKIKKLRG